MTKNTFLEIIYELLKNFNSFDLTNMEEVSLKIGKIILTVVQREKNKLNTDNELSMIIAIQKLNDGDVDTTLNDLATLKTILATLSERTNLQEENEALYRTYPLLDITIDHIQADFNGRIIRRNS